MLQICVAKEDSSPIDNLHDTISKHVVHYAEKLDDTLSGALYRLNSFFGNRACKSDNKKNIRKKTEKRNIFDRFFQNKRYFDIDNELYIGTQNSIRFQRYKKRAYRFRFFAQLPFEKCAKQWRFFVAAKDERQNSLGEKNRSGEIALGYFFNLSKLITRFSLGYGKGGLYTKLLLSEGFDIRSWHIEPVEILRYSFNGSFDESTDIYVDHIEEQNSLYRLQLSRAYSNKQRGMRYSLGLHYYKLTGKLSGWGVSQIFAGDTGYRSPWGRDFQGISEYTTSASYRTSLFRPWLFVELMPAVHFKHRYHYKPQYDFTLRFDIYFGRF